MRRAAYLSVLAMASAMPAWPRMLTISVGALSTSTEVLDENAFFHSYENDHQQLYVRDTTTATAATTTSTAADSTTTTTSDTSTSTATTTSSSTETSSTTTTTATSTSTSTTATSTSTSSTTTSATTTASSNTSTTSSTSSTSSTTSASTTTSSSSTFSASSSASAKAAAELRAWNHAGEVRAIVVFSILGGFALGAALYMIIKRYIKNKANRANRLSTAGSTYSAIPLTAEGKTDAGTLRESMMFS